MDLRALIKEFRFRAGDRATPPLWPDDVVTGWLNDAVDEACERAFLLEDSTTPDVCVIPLVPGQREYVLHPSVIDVLDGYLYNPDGTRRGWCCGPHRTTRRFADRHDWYRGWPSSYAVYGSGNSETGLGRRLVYSQTPDTAALDATFRMTVQRRPLYPMKAMSDQPEIGEQYHRALVWWAIYMAFDNRNSDRVDIARSDRAYQKFVQAFGERRSAITETQQLRHRPPVARSHW